MVRLTELTIRALRFYAAGAWWRRSGPDDLKRTSEMFKFIQEVERRRKAD